MPVPAHILKREIARQGMFPDPTTYDDAIELSIASLRAYGERYPHWMITYSGGKDSSALVSFVIWCLQTGKVEAPKSLTVLYADTRMELKPLHDTAMTVLKRISELGYATRIVQPPLEQRFWVHILGRGLQPPKRTQRWCTRVLKADPMNKAITEIEAEYGSGTVLALTGVRKGESDKRDEVIKTSCSKNDGECGQGWYQQSRHALAPLMHWRSCWVWRWNYGDDNPLKEVLGIEDVYFPADDFQDIRTGCFKCELVTEDLSFKYLAMKPAWKHLAPIHRLTIVYEFLRLPVNRLRKWEPSVNADGRLRDNSGAIGPSTIDARKMAFEMIKDIEAESGHQFIDAEEEAYIRALWDANTYPHGWTGDESSGATTGARKFVKDGIVIAEQPLMKGFKSW